MVKIYIECLNGIGTTFPSNFLVVWMQSLWLIIAKISLNKWNINYFSFDSSFCIGFFSSEAYFASFGRRPYIHLYIHCIYYLYSAIYVPIHNLHDRKLSGFMHLSTRLIILPFSELLSHDVCSPFLLGFRLVFCMHHATFTSFLIVYSKFIFKLCWQDLQYFCHILQTLRNQNVRSGAFPYNLKNNWLSVSF